MDAERTLIQATVVGVNDSSVLYPACKQCCAKVLHDLQHDRWTCVRCNITCNRSQLAWRYRLSLSIADSSASCQVSLFGGILGQYFGCPAGDFQRFISSTTVREQPLETYGNLLMQALETVLVGNIYLFGLKLPKPCTSKPAVQQHPPKQGSVVTVADLLTRHASSSSSTGKVSDFIGVQMIQTAAKSQTGHITVVDALKHFYLQCLSTSSQQGDVSESRGVEVVDPLMHTPPSVQLHRGWCMHKKINACNSSVASSQLVGGFAGGECMKRNAGRNSFTHSQHNSDGKSSQTAVHRLLITPPSAQLRTGRCEHEMVKRREICTFSPVSLPNNTSTLSFCDNSSRTLSQESSSATPLFSCDSSMERDFCSSQLSAYSPQTTERLRTAKNGDKHWQNVRHHTPWSPLSESTHQFEECAPGSNTAVFSADDTPCCDRDHGMGLVPFDGTISDAIGNTSHTHVRHQTVPEFSHRMLTPPSVQLRGGQCEHRRVNSEEDCSLDETLELDTATPEHSGTISCRRESHPEEKPKVSAPSHHYIHQIERRQPVLQPESSKNDSLLHLSCEQFRCENEPQVHSMHSDKDMTYDDTFSTSLNDSSLLLAAIQHEPETTEKTHRDTRPCLREPVDPLMLTPPSAQLREGWCERKRVYMVENQCSGCHERSNLSEAVKAQKQSVTVTPIKLVGHCANSNAGTNHCANRSVSDYNHLSWDESIAVDENFELETVPSPHQAKCSSTECDAADFNTHMPDSEDLSLFLAGVARKGPVSTHSDAGTTLSSFTVKKTLTDCSARCTEKPVSHSPLTLLSTLCPLHSCAEGAVCKRGLTPVCLHHLSCNCVKGCASIKQLMPNTQPCRSQTDSAIRSEQELNPLEPSAHLSGEHSEAQSTVRAHRGSTDTKWNTTSAAPYRSSTDSEVFLEDGALSPTMLDQALMSWCESPKTPPAEQNIAEGQQLQQTLDLPDSEDLFGFLDKVLGESSDHGAMVQNTCTVSGPVDKVGKLAAIHSTNSVSVNLINVGKHAKKMGCSNPYNTIATLGPGCQGTTAVNPFMHTPPSMQLCGGQCEHNRVSESESVSSQLLLNTAEGSKQTASSTDSINMTAVATTHQHSRAFMNNGDLLDGSAELFFSQLSPCQSASRSAVPKTNTMLFHESERCRVISESTFETSESKLEQTSEELKTKLFQDLSASSKTDNSSASSCVQSSKTTTYTSHKKDSHKKRRVRFSGRRSTVSSVDAIDYRLDKYSSPLVAQHEKELQSTPLKSCLQRSGRELRKARFLTSAKGSLSPLQTPRSKCTEFGNGKKISPKALTPIISLEYTASPDIELTTADRGTPPIDLTPAGKKALHVPFVTPNRVSVQKLHQSSHQLQTSGSQDLFSPCSDHSLIIMASQSPSVFQNQHAGCQRGLSSSKVIKLCSSDRTNSSSVDETRNDARPAWKRQASVVSSSRAFSHHKISKGCHIMAKSLVLSENHSDDIFDPGTDNIRDGVHVPNDFKYGKLGRRFMETCKDCDSQQSFVTVRKVRRPAPLAGKPVVPHVRNSDGNNPQLESVHTGYLPESAAAESSSRFSQIACTPSPNSTSVDLFDSSAALFDDDEEKENSCTGSDADSGVGSKDESGCSEKHGSQSQKARDCHLGQRFHTPKQTGPHAPYLIDEDSPALFDSPDLFS